MIILDSNILKGISLRGPEAELLRTIRASRVERVAAPWIVIEELAAQEALRHAEKHEAARDALNTLRRATPWETLPPLVSVDPERVREHWRGRYAELAETLKTGPSTYEAAMFREANLLAPCKTVNSGKHKTGSRDAAIWLTAVEYAHEHPDEKVYFVSNNTEDFGDGTSFRHPLDEDLKGLKDRFVLFTSLDGVVNQFAKQVDAPEEDAVRQILMAADSLTAVAEAARRHHQMVRGSQASVVEPSTRRLRPMIMDRWFGRPAVALSSVSEIRAHEIAGHTWCTATARWLLTGSGRRISYDGQPFNAAWQNRVLLSTTAPESGLKVLGGGPFTLIDYEDIDSLPAPSVPGSTLEGLIESLDELQGQTGQERMREAVSELVQTLRGTRYPTPAEHLLEQLQASGAQAPLSQDNAEFLWRLNSAGRHLHQSDPESD
ncbi:PIN domain-containing protein [Streptomyces sp. NPDC048208]|uniref:PIN domain-containing protein n=1 Tax=Streptomyces sp. NPDC048208 TaxID=3365515 RepID=UPI00371740DC